jgi:hypothetical protein
MGRHLQTTPITYSSLPATLKIQILDNTQDGHSTGFDINFWYDGPLIYGCVDPLADQLFPDTVLGCEDHEFFTFVMTFTCH